MNDYRSRCWFLTCNNYSADELQFARAYKCDFKLLAQEIGELSKLEHYHLYFEHKNPVQWSTLKNKFPRANIQVAKGNAEHQRVYLGKQCGRENIEETGTPKHQGKRTDITRVRNILEEGGNMREIIPSVGSVQSVRMAEIWLKYFEQPRDWLPDVYWIHGSSGRGKTQLAYKMGYEFCPHERPFKLMSNRRWWEGYDAHEVIIIDELREDCYRVSELLQLLDRYEYKVENKGGSRQLLAKHIIITSPKSPENLFFGHGESIYQFVRRCKKIICIDDIEASDAPEDEEF